MDTMAYLQQISDPRNNKSAAKPSKGAAFSRFLTVQNLIIAGAVVLVLILLAIIIPMLTKTDTKDQDLLTRSWYDSYYLSETIDDYSPLLKSSSLRTLATSLRGVMNELMLDDASFLLSDYTIEVEDLEDEDPIALEELSKNEALRATLENARLNGHFDRTFLREITMQTAYLISYQSALAARKPSPAIESAATKSETYLQTLYEQLDNFKDPTI